MTKLLLISYYNFFKLFYEPGVKIRKIYSYQWVANNNTRVLLLYHSFIFHWHINHRALLWVFYNNLQFLNLELFFYPCLWALIANSEIKLHHASAVCRRLLLVLLFGCIYAHDCGWFEKYFISLLLNVLVAAFLMRLRAQTNYLNNYFFSK